MPFYISSESIMVHEGAKTTSYDDLYLEEAQGGRTSDTQEKSTSSLDSRLRRLSARRTTSIIFGSGRTPEGVPNGMGDKNLSSDDDSGGFRSEGSDSDSGGFRTEATEREYTGKSRLRGILKTRRLRRSRKDRFEGQTAEFESHLSITSLDGKTDRVTSLVSGDDDDKNAPVKSSAITPRPDYSDRTREGTIETPRDTADDQQERAVRDPASYRLSPGRQVNGDVSQTSVVTPRQSQTSAIIHSQPPNPPPRSSSYLETRLKQLSPRPPPPPPPPVPERGVQTSSLLAQIRSLRQFERTRPTSSGSTVTPQAVTTYTSVTSITDKRIPGDLVELEEDIAILDSPGQRTITPRSPATPSRVKVTPSGITTPRDSWRSGPAIDAFVPSSPRVEMSQDLPDTGRYSHTVSPPPSSSLRSPTRPQFRKSSDIANLYLYGARGYRGRPLEHVSSISTSSDSALQEAEALRSYPLRYYRPPVPYSRRVLTGNVQKLTKRFEKSIAEGSSHVDSKDSSEEEHLTTSGRLRRLFRRYDTLRSSRASDFRYLTVGPSGDIIQRGPWPSTIHRTPPKSPKSPQITCNEPHCMIVIWYDKVGVKEGKPRKE
ncbi:hypothetical protein SK128_007773 [Halocaridina rubra]|uniref:Uncharacterized protein n=1 Tax=Halocaridina rubra TaxID=373956 RepID=A0AAN8XIM9_HALRR